MKHKLVLKKKAVVKEDTVKNQLRDDELTVYEHCAVEVIMNKKKPDTYARCLMDM